MRCPFHNAINLLSKLVEIQMYMASEHFQKKLKSSAISVSAIK